MLIVCIHANRKYLIEQIIHVNQHTVMIQLVIQLPLQLPLLLLLLLLLSILISYCNASTVITTVAGSGTCGSTDNTAATSGSFLTPRTIAVSPGNDILYIADANNHCIRKVTIATGIVTVAIGTIGVSGDVTGTSGTFALLDTPKGVAVDNAGNVYIADSDNNKIKRVSVATGIVTTIAGTGEVGYGIGGCDTNCAATAATLYGPFSVIW